MGRRPHALVQEFFDRGQKIDDSSNRYSHTCKRCGEVFPKGRIDSLTTHLRRCAGLSEADRTWVHQQLQNGAERAAKQAKRFHRPDRRNAPAPFAMQQQTALETLAEVSGQHSSRTDYQQAGPQMQRESGLPMHIAEAIAEQALIEQLQAQASTHAADQVLAPATASGGLPNSERQPTEPQPTQQPPAISFGPFDGASHFSASPMMATAPAADPRLEHTRHPFPGPHTYDRVHGHPLQSFNVPVDMGLSADHPGEPANDMSWSRHQPAAIHPTPNFGDLTMAQSNSTSGFSILSPNSPPKRRGQFSNDRRKEVSDIRKQGACMRCRMLRKSCSGGEPCQTCANVNSARVWKGRCLRTRLADEMTLWSTRTFHDRASQRVGVASKAQTDGGRRASLVVSLRECPGEIRLPLKGAMSVEDPLENEPPSSTERATPMWLLDGELLAADDLAAWARDRLDHLTQSHPHLTKDILLKSRQISTTSSDDQTNAPAPTEPPTNPKTTKPTPQATLPRNTLDLWILTELLASERLSTASLRVENREDESTTEPIPPSLTETNREAILAQLHAAIEERSSKLSKTVLAELERQLLQRQQTSRFATLLAALTLLSAVERTTAFIHSLPHNSNTDTRPASCPPLWHQGEQFADLLASLLHMRALPPKTRVSATSGMLEAVREQQQQQPPPDPTAADWLDALRLDARTLRAEEAGEGAGRWALRFVGKVLLPA